MGIIPRAPSLNCPGAGVKPQHLNYKGSCTSLWRTTGGMISMLLSGSRIPNVWTFSLHSQEMKGYRIFCVCGLTIWLDLKDILKLKTVRSDWKATEGGKSGALWKLWLLELMTFWKQMKTDAGKKNSYNTKKQKNETVAPAHIKCPGDLKHLLDSKNTSRK